MSAHHNDPMGQAILDFAENGKSSDIVVASEICADDVIPSHYLHRTYDEMPVIEQTALQRCNGRILDVGAGAGVHAAYLADLGKDVTCIDTSPGAVQHMQQRGLNADQCDFFTYEGSNFDTLLLLMNGIGIAGDLENLERTLLKAKSMLTKSGKILCDSSDIKYLYEDEDGSMWMDLSTLYYGNFMFQMTYNKHDSGWFKWLYVDANTLTSVAQKVGLSVTIIEQEEHEYLAELTIAS